MARIFFLVIILGSTQLVSLSQSPDTSFNSNLRLLNNIYQTLSDHYVEPVNKDTVMMNTVYDMLRRLDPYTYFLSSADARKQKERLTNKFAGIGVSMRSIDNDIVITRVIKGFPA